MTKTNAAKIEEAAPAAGVVPHPILPSSSNPSQKEFLDAIDDVLASIVVATTFLVNIPDPEGEVEVEFASDDQNGEVEIVRCRQANRFARMQRGLLDQVIRQLTYAVSAEEREFQQGQAQLRSMFNTLTRSDSPDSIRDAMGKKAGYLDLVKERMTHAQMLLDRANQTYIDLTGTAYVAYEERVKTRRTVDVPAAPADDPILSKCADLLRA